MKKLVIVATVFCAAFASCQGNKSIASYTEIDSLSYAIGVDIGRGIRPAADSALNVDAVCAALKDAFADKALMTPEDATAFINEWFMVRVPAKNLTEGQAWLEEVKADNSNIQTTESGLMYEIVNEGDQSVKAVNDADQVVVSYRGTLRDGFEFDKNDSISFALNGVIAGWTEGMKLVGKGGEVLLWVPSELGYGAQNRGQIPANSPLKFEVKLLDVVPATEAAE